jgi:CHAD domain-containing protein
MKTGIKKRFIKYHRKRWNHIYAGLKDFIKHGGDEELHKVRVETKRITALYHFIETCNGDFDCRKELKPIIEIFKLSGKVRDYRNAKTFCSKYGVSHAYFIDEAKKQQKYLKELKHKRKKYRDKFEDIEATANYFLKDLQSEQLTRHLITGKEEIIRNLQKKPQGKALHEVRKKIKELYFMAGLGVNERRGILNTDDLKSLDKLQDDIGNWHDISKFHEKVQQSAEGGHPNKLASATGEEKRLLREIRKISNEIIHKDGK